MSDEQSNKPKEIDLRPGLEQEIEEALNQPLIKGCGAADEVFDENGSLINGYTIDEHVNDEILWFINRGDSHNSNAESDE